MSDSTTSDLDLVVTKSRTAPDPVPSTNFEKVGEFFRKFGVPMGGVPHLADQDTFTFRFGHLLEELEELNVAYRKADLVHVADALADLVYLAYGTAHTMGIPLDRVIGAVHAKNMTKVRAQSAADSKRGNQLDVVKPPGFVGPEEDIRKILEDCGYAG